MLGDDKADQNTAATSWLPTPCGASVPVLSRLTPLAVACALPLLISVGFQIYLSVTGYNPGAAAPVMPVWTLGGSLLSLLAGAALAWVVARRVVTANRRLGESEHRFRSLVEHAPDAIIVFDTQEQRILETNPIAELLFERSREDLLTGDLVRLLAPLQPDGRPAKESMTFVQGRALAGESVLTERLILTPSGKEIFAELRVDDISESGHRLLRGSYIDISERKQNEVRLHLAASVFSHAREGIIITDISGTIIDVNETFVHITGFSREEAIGENPRIMNSGRQEPEFYEALWQDLGTKGHWSGEIWNRRKNGEVFAEMLTISTVRDDHGVPLHYVALFSDITGIKEHQHQLEHIAHYDVLTNLPNRVLVGDRLRQGIAQSQRRSLPLAVVYLDLDGFKEVNDTHGHAVGDQLLIVVAQRMKAVLREGDTLARIGGDEFIGVLADLDRPGDYETVLSRLLQAASDPVILGERVLQISASIGVTLYPQDGADADQLLRHADQAMYLAKQAGKNRFHLFDVTFDQAAKAQQETLERIRQGLGAGEFTLYFQPKVNMSSGEVIGAEALIRWNHPEQGLLLPGIFLPTIEGHQLSTELGEWVIDRALSQIEAWIAAGLELPVSVNVGAYQLQQSGFIASLRHMLAAHPQARPDLLELEILETSALEDVVLASNLLRACADIGVRFALDDFGTGYSSLTYLKRLPAHLIKIDRSFVEDMLKDREDLTIVRAVIGLAQAFQIDVIAEGVETREHRERLLALGCHLGQGFGIARPMPAEAMVAWVAKWKADIAAGVR